jgi:hypothetical protein
VAGDHQRLVHAAAHHRGGAHAMRQARQVHLLHHLLEALRDVADQPRLGALQPDFAAGHRFGAELVLQPHDPIGVAGAVLQPARQREQREAPRAPRRPLGARKHQCHIGIGVRAEPFLAI